MSPRQLQVLSAMDRITEPGEWWSYFRGIAKEAGLGERETRVVVRALARKGLANYERLMNEDGLVAGSGYAITHEGRRLVREVAP
jgi:hypothetical protein